MLLLAYILLRSSYSGNWIRVRIDERFSVPLCGIDILLSWFSKRFQSVKVFEDDIVIVLQLEVRISSFQYLRLPQEVACLVEFSSFAYGWFLLQVRSLTLDVKVWEPSVISMFQSLGNTFANSVWEEHLQSRSGFQVDLVPTG